MEENQIIEKLEKIFRSVFGKETITINRNTNAGDIAEWNSLNHMIMISEVETAFTLKFKLKELNKMQNVGDLIDLIISKSVV
jgi:acyl carrier protein